MKAAKGGGKLGSVEAMRALKAQRADELAGQVDPAAEARTRERKLLDGLGAAADDLEWLAVNQAWTLLGHDTCAAWWAARVKPVAESLGFQPTRELGMRFVELIRAEEAGLPAAQRRSTKELAAFVGVSEWAARPSSRSLTRRNHENDDLGKRDIDGEVVPEPDPLTAALTQAIRETAAHTSGAVPPASTEGTSLALGEPDDSDKAAESSGTQTAADGADTTEADGAEVDGTTAGQAFRSGDAPAPDGDAASSSSGVTHEQENGWAGPNGDCGASCTCGVMFDGFDTIAEARQLLERHIANPEERDEEEVPCFECSAPLDPRDAADGYYKCLDCDPERLFRVASDSPAAGVTSLPDGEGDPTPEPEQQPGHNSPTGQEAVQPHVDRSETDHHEGSGVSLSGEAPATHLRADAVEPGGEPWDEDTSTSSHGHPDEPASDRLMTAFATLIHYVGQVDAEAVGVLLADDDLHTLDEHIEQLELFVRKLRKARVFDRHHPVEPGVGRRDLVRGD